MMRRTVALGLLLLLGTVEVTSWTAEVTAAPVPITGNDQRDVMVTIYNGNFGLVKDTREARLDSGTAEVKFMDVAAQIDPTSVHLKSVDHPHGLKILEQNYEYDLLSSDKLMEKYVGKTVRLYQSGGSFQEARLLSASGPIWEINGQIHIGSYGTPVLPSLPENLVSQPTLVWLLRNGSGAPQRVEASYLTGGINWKADYVLVIGAADTAADLTGWVTIDNKSGATYKNAALKLVAGDVNRAVERNEMRKALDAAARAPQSEPSRDFRSEGFFEYHLYTLDGRTTLKDKQTKQLSLLSATDVPVDKRFVYYGAADYFRTAYGAPIASQKVGVYLEIKNSQDRRLGMPLPKGRVRVYKADSAGSQQLIGEDWIDHTARDERVKIKMGDAFDVVGERVQKDWKKIGPGLYEVAWEITLRNHKQEPVTVDVIEPVPGDWEMLRSTPPHDKVNAFTVRFPVPVAKDGEAKLEYRVRVRF